MLCFVFLFESSPPFIGVLEKASSSVQRGAFGGKPMFWAVQPGWLEMLEKEREALGTMERL